MVEMNKILSQTNMIKQQLRTGNIFDKKILDLYQSLPRDEYTPLSYRKFAYSDMQIPIAQQQSMLTPLEEAAILQALQLQGHETILEIGTGTGFFSSLLSNFAKRVISVDCFEKPAWHMGELILNLSLEMGITVGSIWRLMMLLF